MSEQKEHERIYIIPQNFSGDGTFKGIPVQNWIEGAAFAGSVAFLMWQIPFLFYIRICVTAISALFVLLVFLHGIHDESILTFLVGYLQFLSRRNVYRLKRPDEYLIEKEKGGKKDEEKRKKRRT